MSKFYTTGEVATLCGTTVRTVQYYDKCGLLSPSELSEGGRRLYTGEDMRTMRIVCLLRELDFPLSAIKRLLKDSDSTELITMLIAARKKELDEEIDRQKEMLARLSELEGCLSSMEKSSLAAIGDADYVLKRRKNRRQMLAVMLTIGILMDVIEIGTLLLGIVRGNWLPFAVGMPLVIAMGIYITSYYYRHAEYICPACHTRFRPKLTHFLFAAHTPNTRKVTCTNCHHHGFCIEAYRASKKGEKHAEN